MIFTSGESVWLSTVILKQQKSPHYRTLLLAGHRIFAEVLSDMDFNNPFFTLTRNMLAQVIIDFAVMVTAKASHPPNRLETPLQ